MNAEYREALNQQYSRKYAMLQAVQAAILELVEGAQSATLSSGGASQSYTRAGLGELHRLEGAYSRDLAAIDAALRASTSRFTRRHIFFS